MWRHFPHHKHARCREISDFSTSVMRRNLKLLDMWKKFRFLHICHVEKFESTPHVEKFQISPHAYISEISPHDKFFSTCLTCELFDKYELCVQLGTKFLEPNLPGTAVLGTRQIGVLERGASSKALFVRAY